MSRLQEHESFLYGVMKYVKDNPEVGAYVSDYVAAGIEEARKQALERAADMEVALSVAIANRFKNREALILDKLNKWNGKSSLRWDSVIEMLEGKTK